jgi:hypothetical protein
MTDYLVTLNDPDSYKVQSASDGPYRVGVNYEIPTKSIQYGNIILDDISSFFDGIEITFSLFENGIPYVPINDQQLLVMSNGSILKPGKDYTTSTNNIIFTNPPLFGVDNTIVALATTADLTRTINYIVDSGSLTTMIPGSKGTVTLDVSGILDSLTIFSEQEGDLTLDIKKSNYSNFPDFTSIVGNEYPELINSKKMRLDDLSNWDNVIEAGDVLEFHVIDSLNITRFLIALKLKL